MDVNVVEPDGSAVMEAAIDELMDAQQGDIALSKAERIERFQQLISENQVHTLAKVLPLLLNLKGKPYTLLNHFPFEELFRFTMPDEYVFMTGRQVAKTTSTAAEGVIKTSSIPHITQLYCTPLFEQVRRFSTMFVQPFIEQSPVKRLWVGTSTTQSVLQRSFKNNSKMVFSFALLNADRVRGISADMVSIDEIQDMMRDHLPIIMETMSASPWSITRYTGTPKTLDNTLTTLWRRSSQAEWFIPCTHCTTGGHPTWNIPSLEFHLDDMVGPYRDDISEKRPATICHKCRQSISPRLGMWRHRYPEKRWSCAGYHIPQIIMPLHYADRTKWSKILAKREGWGNTPMNVFYNEVMGEPIDTASKLVSMTELMAAARLGPKDPRWAKARARRYKYLTMGVDWGGGGEDGISFTTIALVGMTFDGKLEVIWGKRLLTPHDHIGEAREIKWWWDYFRPHLLAHDYTGAGSLRETFLGQSGINVNSIMPCMYVGAAKKAICYHVAPTIDHPRHHYRIDKSRSLLLTCAMIKLGGMQFFNWDFESDENRGLIYDFLALIEEKTQTMSAGELYRIDRADDMTDDFAQAVNLATVACWYRARQWPDLHRLAQEARLGESFAAAMSGASTLFDDSESNWMPDEMRV